MRLEGGEVKAQEWDRRAPSRAAPLTWDLCEPVSRSSGQGACLVSAPGAQRVRGQQAGWVEPEQAWGLHPCFHAKNVSIRGFLTPASSCHSNFCHTLTLCLQVFDGSGSFLSYINTSADPLYGPQGLALTSDGHVVVADSGNHCFKVYRYLQ